MKDLALTVLGGIGLLIFAYLLFANGKSSLALLNASAAGSNTVIKTLQGR